MRLLGNTAGLLHLAGELVMVAAGAWGLYRRIVLAASPIGVMSWFGPLALLSIGLLLAVLPLAPARQAAWIRHWIRPQLALGSLLWSFAVCGCLYTLWLQYSLEFTLRTVLMLLPGFIYWFAVASPGRVAQQRNIDQAAGMPEQAGRGEVQRA